MSAFYCPHCKQEFAISYDQKRYEDMPSLTHFYERLSFEQYHLNGYCINKGLTLNLDTI